MIREYKNTPETDVSFFKGIEVERTPAYGQQTLFVVGIQSYADIYNNAQGCTHIFFGANHSFDPLTYTDWSDWEAMIRYFLDQNFLCSLDIPITAIRDFNEGGLCEHHNFIPQIRIPIPYIKAWNYNTMIKLDDTGFNETNPGVWCHSLHDLQSRDKFTMWNQYKEDIII